jgi:hypothetical protein
LVISENEGNTEEENNGYVVLNEIFTDQLGNRVVAIGGRRYSHTSTPFFTAEPEFANVKGAQESRFRQAS